MKKISVFIIAAALAVSCTRLEKNEYEITARIDPAYNGKQVFLKKGEDQSSLLSVLDTAVVENGSFTFRGKTEKPFKCFIFIEGMAKDSTVLFAERKGRSG